MLRSDIVLLIAEENPHLSKQDAERIVDVILDEMINAMANGGRVEIRGFGSFSVRHRDARMGRNPKTGEPVKVEPKSVPHFKCSKELLARLNSWE
jgi:integration host factor subunit beta